MSETQDAICRCPTLLGISQLASWTRQKVLSRRLSIRSHVLCYGAVALIPPLCLAGALAFSLSNAQRQVIEAQQLDVVNNLTFVLDREIEGLKGVLQALAVSPDLQGGRLEQFSQQAKAAAKARNLNAFTVSDRMGQQLFSTLVPAGSPLPKRDDRDLLEAVFAGKTYLSDITTGATSHRQIVIIAVPVMVGDSVNYALSAGIALDYFTGLFAEAGVKPDWTATILDRKGIFIARNKNADILVGQPSRPKGAAAAAGKSALGLFDDVSLEGTRVSASFRRLPLGWTAVVAVPTSILNAPSYRSLAWLAITSTALILFTLGVGSWMARRITEPIRSLRRSALNVLEGRAPTLPHHQIAELDEVGRAFRYASAVSAERLKLQHQLQQAVAIAAIGTFEHEHLDETIQMSPALRAMLGFDDSAPVSVAAARSLIVAEDHPLIADRRRLAENPNSDGVFISEHRINHPKGGIRWMNVRAKTFFEGEGPLRRPVRTIGAVRETTERKRIEEHLRLLLREAAHRAKNMLAVIQAMARQTARSAETVEDFQRSFQQRIQGIAASIDLLVNQDWIRASLADLVRGQLAIYIAGKDARLHIDGPEIAIDERAAQGIGLALQELAVNAIKYGSLSLPTGTLAISWAVEGSDAGGGLLRVKWQERGGPQVTLPTRKGFGTIVTERMVAQMVDGSVKMDFAPEGLTWELLMPTSHVVDDGAVKTYGPELTVG